MEQTELAQRMLLYRARENISQSELARRTHVTLQTIHNVECGHFKPRKITEIKIRMVVDKPEKQEEQEA